jgi:uncharacterized protein (TIGR02996 family)
MSEEAAFLSALKANPADDTARLVYADWLDDHDQPHKAEYLRAVVEVAREACGIEVLDALAGRVDSEWAVDAAARFALVLESYEPARKIDAIKIVREITGMGLAEAKQFVEQAPSGFLYRTTGEGAYGLQRYFGPGRVRPSTDLANVAARPSSAVRFSVVTTLELLNYWDEGAAFVPEAVTAFREFVAKALGLSLEKTTELTETYYHMTLAEHLTYNRSQEELARCDSLRVQSDGTADWFVNLYTSLHVTNTH